MKGNQAEHSILGPLSSHIPIQYGPYTAATLRVRGVCRGNERGRCGGAGSPPAGGGRRERFFWFAFEYCPKGGGPPLWRQTPQLGGFPYGLSLDKAIPKRTVPSKRRPQIHCCLKVPGVVSVPTEHSLVVDNTTLPGSWKSTNHKTISGNQPWSTLNPRIQDVRTFFSHQSGHVADGPQNPAKYLKHRKESPGALGGSVPMTRARPG